MSRLLPLIPLLVALPVGSRAAAGARQGTPPPGGFEIAPGVTATGRPGR